MTIKPPNTVPKRLQTLRVSEQLTQVRLAYILGVSPSTVSRWEAGLSLPRMSIERIEHIVTGVEPKLTPLACGRFFQVGTSGISKTDSIEQAVRRLNMRTKHIGDSMGNQLDELFENNPDIQQDPTQLPFIRQAVQELEQLSGTTYNEYPLVYGTAIRQALMSPSTIGSIILEYAKRLKELK